MPTNGHVQVFVCTHTNFSTSVASHFAPFHCLREFLPLLFNITHRRDLWLLALPVLLVMSVVLIDIALVCAPVPCSKIIAAILYSTKPYGITSHLEFLGIMPPYHNYSGRAIISSSMPIIVRIYYIPVP